MLKGSRLLAVLPTLGRPWTAKVLATEALVGAAKAQLGAMLESLVAHRLIDLGSECTAIGMSIVHGRFAWRRRCAGIQKHLISLFELTLRQ